MIKNFMDIAFTDSVKAIQEEMGSRNGYVQMEKKQANELSAREKAFIEAQRMFYMSSVGENGWPYVQYRGGRPGFLKMLSPSQLGFADFRGNKQYISTGNIKSTGKTVLILMDYTRKARLKIWAESKILSLDENPALSEQLIDPTYDAKVERLMIMDVKGFDWNCPQHIEQRFTIEELSIMLRTGQMEFEKEFLIGLLERYEK